MTVSVSRVRTKPAANGGLEVDVAITTQSGEASVVSLRLSSRATEEVQTLLRQILPAS